MASSQKSASKNDLEAGMFSRMSSLNIGDPYNKKPAGG
jgi:hypothetical protein